MQVGAHDRSRAGEAVVFPHAGRTGGTQHTVEADVAGAVMAIEEHGAACVACAEPVAVDAVRIVDLAVGRVDVGRELTNTVVLLVSRA